MTADPARAASVATAAATRPRRRRRSVARRRSSWWRPRGRRSWSPRVPALAAFRYLPAVDEARALRADLETMARPGPGGRAGDRPGDDGRARRRPGSPPAGTPRPPRRASSRAIRSSGSPRAFPPTAAYVRGADDVVAAADDLLDAAGDGPRHRPPVRRDQGGAGDRPGERLGALAARRADGHVARPRRGGRGRGRRGPAETLAAVPDGLVGPVESVRDAMRARIDALRPAPRRVRRPRARACPSILGWDAPRRYLVLTQNPAELRPTGGYIGSYGIVTFDKGRITERMFQDVFLLDLPWDYPFIQGRRRSCPTTCSARRSRGSWPTPTGRRTSRPAPGTPSGSTRTSPATRGSTACWRSRRTRSTSC